MHLLLTLLLASATAFPSASKTSWMRPEAFHLAIGMKRAEVMKALETGGWSTKPERDDDHLVVDYSGNRSLTLEFRKERLHAIRFELFEMLPEIAPAFTEQKALLLKTLGKPKALKSKSVLLYDSTLPNVMVVLANDPKSIHGRQGFGMLVVRYYDPVD
jgi:hypothetical protein